MGGMDDAKPSLARRAIAVLVLAIVAVVAIRIVVGVLSAVFWIVAIVVLAIAALWAVTTLKGAKRDRQVKRSSSPKAAAVAAPEDRVDAQLAQIREQLRQQGRL